uniref:Uncharacterized protein n=1 Tax=Anguilla anguilla TaxID=7936 RepID=A0A0E9W6L3_ANGAN
MRLRNKRNCQKHRSNLNQNQMFGTSFRRKRALVSSEIQSPR